MSIGAGRRFLGIGVLRLPCPLFNENSKSKAMSYKNDIIKERFDIEVSAANQVFKGEFELDKNAGNLFGLVVTGDDEFSLFYRGSQKILVNDTELFPEDFESKLLMTSLAVSPNDRMIRVGCVPVGNGRVDVWYKDTDHPLKPFAPYRVSLYFFSKVK
jgi:hypothetical protein